MKTTLAKWSLILLCFSTAGSIGGGLYEHIRAYTSMECVTAIVICDYTTRYRSTPAKFLDSRSCSYYDFHRFVPFFYMAGNQESAPTPLRSWLLYHHARLERSVFHPRDA
jgi:hypothetical protein